MTSLTAQQAEFAGLAELAQFVQSRPPAQPERRYHRFRSRTDSQLPSAAQPPSTERQCPLIKLLSLSSARNAMADANTMTKRATNLSVYA